MFEKVRKNDTLKTSNVGFQTLQLLLLLSLWEDNAAAWGRYCWVRERKFVVLWRRVEIRYRKNPEKHKTNEQINEQYHKFLLSHPAAAASAAAFSSHTLSNSSSHIPQSSNSSSSSSHISQSSSSCSSSSSNVWNATLLVFRVSFSRTFSNIFNFVTDSIFYKFYYVYIDFIVLRVSTTIS